MDRRASEQPQPRCVDVKFGFHDTSIEKELVEEAVYLEPDFRDQHTICFCSLPPEIFLTLDTIQSGNLAD